MPGWRKFAVIVLYILSVTAVGLTVLFTRQDSLIGVAAFAGGLSSGLFSFMWGNVQSKKQNGNGAGSGE